MESHQPICILTHHAHRSAPPSPAHSPFPCQAYKLSLQAAPGAAVLWTNPAPPVTDGDKDYSAAAEPYKAPSQLAVQAHPEGEGASAPPAAAAEPYTGPGAYGDSSGYGSSAAFYAPVRPTNV